MPTTYVNIGSYVDRGQVEKQTLAHIENWILEYLADVERKQTPPLVPETIVQPKSFDIVTSFQRYPEESLPFIAVISPGLANGRKPRIDGDGMVTAWWSVGVGAVVSAASPRASKDLAGFYGVALRLIMMQIPQLGGWASGVDWMDEKYDDLARVQERTISACRLVFDVEVQDVMNIYQAPRTLDGQLIPRPNPYAAPEDYPTVTQTPTINVDRMEGQ